jgi:transposase
VINLATETDIDRVRQVAILLERENSRLHKRLQELTEKLACAQGKDATTLQLEIAYLKETLERQNRALFGASSEKRTSRPAKRDDDREPQRGHGPSAQPKLPIVEVIHKLDEADKACPSCGGVLAEMGEQFEESEEVDVVERSFRLVRHKRTKYRCSCGCAIETAPGPEKLIAGGRYSINFAVEVAIEKYLLHMPLARQERQMERQGLTVSTQTLWDQLFALGEHLRPSYAALRDLVLTSPVIGADETTWRLMGGGQSKTWWAWSICSEQGVYHHIHATRGVEAAEAILGSYAGVIVCDGYTAYSALERKRRHSHEGPAPPVLAHCWSHVRRKFFEAEPHDQRATEALDLINNLFAIEAEAYETANGDLRARRAELRAARSREVITEIRRWMLTQRALPKSALGRAISYADGMWEGLCRFLEHPDAPIHNNATERGLRGIALGRKNHYGSRSHRGTVVAALCYSMIESARVAGVDPGMYLRQAARRAIANPGTVTLPHDLLNN